MRGSGKLALKVLEWALQGQERGSPRPDFTTESGVEDSSITKSEKATTTKPILKQQQESVEQAPRRIFPALNLFSAKSQQEASKTLPRTFPLLDLLVPKTKQVSSKESTTSSKESTYVETEDSYGRYLKRVAVE